MTKVEQNFYQRVEVNPKVLIGKPVIRGTRIGVGFLLRLMAAGEKPERILHNFPVLTRKDLEAALFYASTLIDSPKPS